MIAWLIQSRGDLVMPAAAWLSAAEQAECAGLRTEKRRQDWLVGRWTAKRLIQAARFGAGTLPLDEIQLEPAQGRRPLAWWPGCGRPWPLSISHCDGRAAAALDDDPEAPVGVDLERVEIRQPGFAEDYFTPEEQASLGHSSEARAERATAIWCAKEAALKALGVGLTLDTRAVNVRLAGADRPEWRGLEVDVGGAAAARANGHSGGGVWPGWWRRHGPCVLAVVSGEAAGAAEPVEVQPGVCGARVA